MTEVPQLEQVLEGDIPAWVDALPAYQRIHIQSMLVTTSPTEVAIAWLSSSGPTDTAPFGGIRASAARFYDNLLIEMQKLLCGAQEYEQDRLRLVQAASGGKLMVVGVISTAIAPYVGAAAAVLGPAIALTLGVLGNAGQASICQTLDELIAERTSSKESQADTPSEPA